MGKIKILEVINEAAIGGGQKHLFLLARGLNKEKFDVIVASSGKGPLREELMREEIKYVSLKMKRKLNFFTIFKIARLIKKEEIDILHTHGGIAGFTARLGGIIGNVRIIVHTLHGIHYLNYKNRLLKWICILLESLFSMFTDAVIFVSDSDMQKARRFKLAKERKIHVIKNGIDFSEFNKKVDVLVKKKALGLDSTCPIVGTIARLHRQKGHIHLLKAVKRIIRVKPETRFLIVGDGPLRDSLVYYKEKLGIGNNVIFLGERKDVPELLQVIDIFVLPSLWEGFPITLLEAMASGTAVIATNVDGNKEIVEDKKTGLLVNPGNPEVLSSAICKLLGNRNYCSKLALQGKRELLNKFGVSRMVKKTEALYVKLYKN